MRKNLFPILMLAALSWSLSGCSSDSTAPDEGGPPLQNRDVASQAGYLAVAMVKVAPVGLTYESGKDVGEYEYEFTGGDLEGVVYLQFRTGGPTGTLTPYQTANWARASTVAPHLTLDLVPQGIPWQLSLDLAGDLDRATDTATISGSGTLVIGDFQASWTATDLIVRRQGDNNWLSSGTLTFVNQDFTAVVTYSGSSAGNATATVTVGGQTWTINLGNGTLTP